MKVVILSDSSPIDLQKKINEELIKWDDERIVDIKFNNTHVLGDGRNTPFSSERYAAMIIIK